MLNRSLSSFRDVGPIRAISCRLGELFRNFMVGDLAAAMLFVGHTAEAQFSLVSPTSLSFAVK